MTKTSRLSGSVPDDVTTFVGRQGATAEVKRLLSVSRLVTLTGPGGVGKSRLALRIARDLRRAFPDGVWVVELAKVLDPSLVDHTVAAALELRERPDGDLRAVLVDYLTDKQLLLVLDNCEHLLDACQGLVNAVLPRAPWTHVLTTSRAPLSIMAEHIYAVQPMSVPEEDFHAKVGDRYEALALFEERATAVLPDFTLNEANERTVATLCQRLDGLPLAIELAAVRMRVLSVEQILARLEDRFEVLKSGDRSAIPRHQTLQAAIDWSFDLCSPQERLLWARTVVFAGDFDLEAAESVCSGKGLPAADVFPALAGLVEKSILVRGEAGARARYQMLDTVRAYGMERLADGDDARPLADLRRSHRDYYLQLAEEADAAWFGPSQVEWSTRLKSERTNLWTALDYCLTEPGEARTALRLAGAMWCSWVGLGFIPGGRYWLDRALTLDTEPSRERAKALWVNGWLAILRGDYAAALDLTEECRRVAAQCDESALAYALEFAGLAHATKGDFTIAMPMLSEALSRHQANGEPGPLAIAFFYASAANLYRGDLDRTVVLVEECLRLCTAHGEHWVAARTRWILAIVAKFQGNTRLARKYVDESLRFLRTVGDDVIVVFCIELLAWIAAAEGDADRSAQLLGASRRLWQPLGSYLRGSGLYLSWHDECESQIRVTLGDRKFESAFRQGTRLTADEAIAYALDEPALPAGSRAGSTLGPVLTNREREVAGLVAEGLSNRDIAARLVVAQRTAEGHVERILRKLGFSSRAQLAAWVVEQKKH
ncbi:LuxR family transcriptional regulator [Actinoallomurus acanthiterrae]